MAKPVYFTESQAQRVADVVRAVEGESLDLTGKPRRGPRGAGGGSVPLGTLFAVRLTQTGGSNGTSTTAPTYTYTIDDINDVELEGTAQSPELARPNGAVTAATRGMAYRNSAGDIVLFYAHELPSTTTCAT